MSTTRYYRLEFERYGGEVCMGKISGDQFNYWEGKDDELAEYMHNKGFEKKEFNNEIPKNAQFEKDFFEYDDICHTSGPEFSEEGNNQLLLLREVDKNGKNIKDENDNELEPEEILLKDFKSLGTKITCIEQHNSESESCKDKYYIFGQYFHKGKWSTNELIITGDTGINFKKLEIEYRDCDGFKVFESIKYDEKKYFFDEDFTGKESRFFVMEGDDV